MQRTLRDGSGGKWGEGGGGTLRAVPCVSSACATIVASAAMFEKDWLKSGVQCPDFGFRALSDKLSRPGLKEDVICRDQIAAWMRHECLESALGFAEEQLEAEEDAAEA